MPSRTTALQKPTRTHVEVRRDRMAATRDAAKAPASSMDVPFFSFRYSYTEISAVGSTAFVKRRETRFENGKLSEEAFEGSVDGRAFDRLAREAHDTILRQTAMLMKSLFWFLPAPPGRDGD